MPTYAYACTECDHRFEQHQAFSEAALTQCPQCSGRLRKLFNSVGIVFKGSGFYRTDSRKDTASTAPAAGAESKGAESKVSESKDAKSSESKTEKPSSAGKDGSSPATSSSSSSDRSSGGSSGSSRASGSKTSAA